MTPKPIIGDPLAAVKGMTIGCALSLLFWIPVAILVYRAIFK